MALAFETHHNFPHTAHPGRHNGCPEGSYDSGQAFDPQLVPPASFNPYGAVRPVSTNPATPAMTMRQIGLPPATPSRATYWRRRAVAVLVVATLIYTATIGAIALAKWFVTPAEATWSTMPVVTAPYGAEADLPVLDQIPAAQSDAPIVGYLVQPGDTLWSIAQDLQLSGDIRQTVSALAEANGGPSLQPGQLIDLTSVVS